MKTVVVPIDFSADSINALEHAIPLSNKLNSPLELIHVKKSDKFSVPEYFKDFNKKYENNADYYFNILINKYADKIKNKTNYTIKKGKVYKEVSEFACQKNAQYIVIGTHGISGFEEYWIGSNAYKVVSNACCPVLTVRSGFLRTDINKIVLPIDISIETRQKVPVAIEIAKLFKAEIHILAVRESNSPGIIEKLNKYSEQVEEYIKNKNVKYKKDHLFGSNITETTIEYAISINAELITIMTEQMRSTKNLWLGPYAQQMVNRSPIPVLSVRPE